MKHPRDRKQMTLNGFNRVLALSGHPEQLIKGRGYFYFINVGACKVPSTSICVARINDLTWEQWEDELTKAREEEASR